MNAKSQLMPLWRRGWTIRLFNNSIDREKGQTHSGITLTVFAMSESPKFYQITKKYKSRFEKRKDRLASRSTAYCFRKTEERYPYVTAAAAQQQLSSSSSSSRSSSGGGGGGGGEGGVGGGSTASLFGTAVAAPPWSTRRKGEAI